MKLADIIAQQRFKDTSVTWAQFVQRYPRMSAVNAGVFMGVTTEQAEREIIHARRQLRRPIEHRLTGTRKIACHVIGIPLVKVRVSDAKPDSTGTNSLHNLNPDLPTRKGTGSLACAPSDDAIDHMPSVETMVTSRDQLNSRKALLPHGCSFDPNWYKLGREACTDIRNMSNEERIDIGDLSMTGGDMAAMRALQAEARVAQSDQAKAA